MSVLLFTLFMTILSKWEFSSLCAAQFIDTMKWHDEKEHLKIEEINEIFFCWLFELMENYSICFSSYAIRLINMSIEVSRNPINFTLCFANFEWLISYWDFFRQFFGFFESFVTWVCIKISWGKFRLSHQTIDFNFSYSMKHVNYSQLL